MAATTAVHYRWTDVPSEQVNADILRKYVTADRVTVARFELKRGGIVPRHVHDNEQISCILSGALKFIFDGHEVTVRAGEVLAIPGGVAHAAEVVEDTVAMDVFSPVRRDWIDGTDTYFRR